jgi:hypothetical protein
MEITTTIACIHCNWLAIIFLPLALWVINKFRKNHNCPCDCHEKYEEAFNADPEELGRCAVEQAAKQSEND